MDEFKSDLDQVSAPSTVQTARKDGGGGEALYVDKFGKPTTNPPVKVVEPEKPKQVAPAPIVAPRRAGDGEGFGTYRVANGRVQNLRTGAYEDGREERQWGGFGGPLVAGMHSRKIGGGA